MKSPHSNQRGILLLEALISILIISFGVLGLVALWANSVKNVSDARYRSDASFLANEVISQLWLSPRPLAAGCNPPANWTARVTAMLPNGAGNVCVAADPNPPGLPQATVTITWQLPGHASHTFTAKARINGSGPM